MMLTWDDTVRVTGIGLQRLKSRKLRNRERVEIAMHLADVDNSVRWCVADLLCDTEDAITHGAKASHYAAVAAAIPYNVSARTLENWASVARRIPYHERYQALSFSHHIELATLDSVENIHKFAEMAVENNWSVRALRQAIQQSRNPQQSHVRMVEFAHQDDTLHDAVVDAERARDELERVEQENYTLRLSTGTTGWNMVELAEDVRVMIRVPDGENPDGYAKKRLMEVLHVGITE